MDVNNVVVLSSIETRVADITYDWFKKCKIEGKKIVYFRSKFRESRDCLFLKAIINLMNTYDDVSGSDFFHVSADSFDECFQKLLKMKI